MKKNRTMRIATLMLALTLITCCFVGSTFAKYTSTVNDTDSAIVAKWQIMLNDDEELSVTTPSFDFDLFNTIKDSDGSVEDDVRTTGTYIAPGTQGSFDIKVENLSDVTAEYKIVLEETVNALDVPILYSTDETDWKELSALSVPTTELAIDASAQMTIYWKWDFAGDHTSIGIEAKTPTSVEVKATITVEQVD